MVLPSKEEETGGAEVIGLVYPSAREFSTQNPTCNEGESEEPTGKDSNESVYEAERVEFGRARTGHSGTGAVAPEERNPSSGRHRTVAHGQTSLVTLSALP
ncbi:unnamed protein product [Ectocarpus sp. CCAP 1310/34]|nr:unnamed protein product [Ectocarpus sp. CCAP 1310/34]